MSVIKRGFNSDKWIQARDMETEHRENKRIKMVPILHPKNVWHKSITTRNWKTLSHLSDSLFVCVFLVKQAFAGQKNQLRVNFRPQMLFYFHWVICSQRFFFFPRAACFPVVCKHFCSKCKRYRSCLASHNNYKLKKKNPAVLWEKKKIRQYSEGVKLCYSGNFLLPLKLRAEVLSTIAMITISLVLKLL